MSLNRWSRKDTERRLDITGCGCSDIVEALEKFAYINEARVRRMWHKGRMGGLLRSADPIAFEVQHQEWVREYTRLGSVRTKGTNHGHHKNQV